MARSPLWIAWLVEDKEDKEELMNKEELMTLLTPQGTLHCSCLEHSFLFPRCPGSSMGLWLLIPGTQAPPPRDPGSSSWGPRHLLPGTQAPPPRDPDSSSQGPRLLLPGTQAPPPGDPGSSSQAPRLLLPETQVTSGAKLPDTPNLEDTGAWPFHPKMKWPGTPVQWLDMCLLKKVRLE